MFNPFALAKMLNGSISKDELLEMAGAMGISASIDEVERDPAKLGETLEPIILEALASGATFHTLKATAKGKPLFAFIVLPKQT